jgi:hypothetical protein
LVANTVEEAVAEVKEILSDRIAKDQIIRVEVYPVNEDSASSVHRHPWMQFAEKLKDNPLLDEIDQYIAESRQALRCKEDWTLSSNSCTRCY